LKRLGFIAAAIALLVVAAPATATHVQCGDTITQSEVLDSDIVCTEPGSVGVYIGASNVTLRLAGWTISNTAGGGVGVQAVPATGEYTNLHVRKGTITGFDTGIEMTASDSSVVNIATTGPDDHWRGALFLHGDRNRAEKNSVDGIAYENEGVGIYIEGDDALTRLNTVTEVDGGIWSLGDRPQHLRNDVSWCFSTGILVEGYTTRAVVNRSTARCEHVGIFLESALESGGGARVRLNDAWAVAPLSGHGFWISDATGIVEHNTASDSGLTGIQSARPGTAIGSNTAIHNGGYGIYAAEGTVDLGGNTAADNGYEWGGGTPQCVNVTCTAP
jgi:hypothetical protein